MLYRRDRHQKRQRWLLLLGLCAAVLLAPQGQRQGSSATVAQVTLAWDQEPMPPGVTLTGWQVQRCEIPKGTSTCPLVDLAGALVPASTPMIYVDSSVTAGTWYLYAVVALGTGGGGIRSAPSNVVTNALPVAPKNLRLTGGP